MHVFVCFLNGHVTVWRVIGHLMLCHSDIGDIVANWLHLFKVKKYVFGGNVCILACISFICRTFS